jgi:predicted nucleotidyltransferase component of viral defense system
VSFGNFFLNFGTRKVCLAKSTLNDLQNDFLREFFKHENHFYLSGGAALAGFYFGHRETHDLDLFTLENEMENGFRLVLEVAKEIHSSVDPIQTSPDFRRLLVNRGDESIVVDLVREYVFQIEHEKRVVNGIRIDTPEEIFANKLCALLSRSEIRDLVDIRELENSGFDLEAALEVAEKKDSGLTPAQLAWVLAQIEFSDDAKIPGEISVSVIRDYLKSLTDKLKRLAFPK